MNTTELESPATAAVDVTASQSGPCGHHMPSPEKEHQWLQQFVGEWESEMEICMGPDQPPMKSTGTESARLLGGFWMISEGKGDESPFANIFTLGFDTQKKKYVGTWVDSMGSYLWKYEGSVDSSGKILTLETEGPAPMSPGELRKYREVTEFKSKDHKIFTSSILSDDGQWNTFVTINARRKG